LPPLGIDINADVNAHLEHLPPPHGSAYSSLPLESPPKDGPIISHDNLAEIFQPQDPVSASHYVPKNLPEHFDSELPLYKDDPKDHLKAFLPQIYSDHSDAPVYREGTGPLQPIRAHHEPLVTLSQTYAHHYDDYIPGIPGIPWKDYPLYHSIPHTSFQCVYTKYPGFYADVETGCQVSIFIYYI
jgi:hypothetical protein